MKSPSHREVEDRRSIIASRGIRGTDARLTVGKRIISAMRVIQDLFVQIESACVKRRNFTHAPRVLAQKADHDPDRTERLHQTL